MANHNAHCCWLLFSNFCCPDWPCCTRFPSSPPSMNALSLRRTRPGSETFCLVTCRLLAVKVTGQGCMTLFWISKWLILLIICGKKLLLGVLNSPRPFERYFKLWCSWSISKSAQTLNLLYNILNNFVIDFEIKLYKNESVWFIVFKTSCFIITL